MKTRRLFPPPCAMFSTLVCVSIFATIIVVEASVASTAPLSSARCDQQRRVTPYLVAKILALQGVSREDVKLERESLENALPFFEEEISDGNFSSLRACASGIKNLTLCLKDVCPQAAFSDEEADSVYSVISEALQGRCNHSLLVSDPEEIGEEGEGEAREEEEHVPWQTSVGYGTAFAAVVIAGSQFGGLLYPFRKHIVYKIFLTYLIGLACGTLAGGGVLHLMPASLDLQDGPDHAYVYKAAMILGGAYLFYWVERLLRDVSKWNKAKKNRLQKAKKMEASREMRNRLLNNAAKMEAEVAVVKKEKDRPRRKVSLENRVERALAAKEIAEAAAAAATAENGKATSTLLTSEELIKDLFDSNQNNNDATPPMKMVKRERFPSHSSRSQIEPDTDVGVEGEVAPIAWILIMAKIFSTFIDGLSMGAAFTDTIPMGIKIGIAIICEEYPHELGDIAVLLNSGMNFKRALLWNFLAASAVLPGVYVGILAGGAGGANPWIFAIAAGMFVYIALVDMIPELNNLGEELSQAGVHYALVTLIQHLGLFSGFMLMFCMAVWGDKIGT